MQLARLALCLVLALAGCKHARSYPDTPDGLKDLIGDVRSGSVSGDELKLPDAERWFTDTFGDPELAARLAGDLAKRTSVNIGVALKRLEAEGKSEITVERFTDPDDPAVCGNASYALKHAKHPLALYSVRITPPGKKLGIHMYSFAYVDKAFRFLGKLDQLHPEKPGEDPAVQAVFELRNRDREAYFKTGKLPSDL